MRRRILLSYLIITGVVLVLLMLPLGLTYQRRQIDEDIDILTRRGQAVSTAVEDVLEEPPKAPGAIGLEAVDRISRVPLDRGERVVVLDDHGHRLAERGRGAAISDARLASLLNSSKSRGAATASERGRRFVVVPVRSQGHRYGTVIVARSTAAVDRRVAAYRLVLLGGGAFAMALVVAIGLALARSVTAPLEDLRRVTRRFGRGELDARADADHGPAEMRDLANDFNHTADQLTGLMAAQASFVADASHQLRTPLTALRFRLENLAADVAEVAEDPLGHGADSSPESIADDLEGAVVEVDRMSRLVDGLLALARADARSGTASAAIDLRQEAQDRVDAWAALAQEHDVHLSCAPGPPMNAQADPDGFAQILDNLVANALDAVSEGGSIRVELVDRPTVIELHVIDDGPGMSPADRTRAFDRFWRRDRPGPDGSPNRPGLGGSGLGLAVVAGLAASDNATARLEPAPGGGTDAVVTYRRR